MDNQIPFFKQRTRNRSANVDLVVLNRADVIWEVRTSSERLRERWELMMARREYAQERCASMVSQKLLDRRLNINPGRNRKLSPYRCDFAGRHAKVFQQVFRNRDSPKPWLPKENAKPIQQS